MDIVYMLRVVNVLFSVLITYHSIKLFVRTSKVEKDKFTKKQNQASIGLRNVFLGLSILAILNFILYSVGFLFDLTSDPSVLHVRDFFHGVKSFISNILFISFLKYLEQID